VIYFPFYPFALLGFIASLPPAIRAYRERRRAVPWVVTAYGCGFALYAIVVTMIIKAVNRNGW
jgi:predicted MFS family arabinose efflux permease